MRTDRIAALSQLANLQKAADLARLAQISARLQSTQALHDQTEDALSRQTDLATRSPEPPVWQVLDAHAILAQQVLTLLAAEIDRIGAERGDQRQICARSFGRAQMLDRIYDDQPRRSRNA